MSKFLNFLNNITEKDKVSIFTHTDLDGIASAIFVEEILKEKNIKVSFLKFLQLKNKNLQEQIPTLKKNKINKLFILDVAVDSIDPVGFEKVKKVADVLLVDHHPSAKNFDDDAGVIKTKTRDCVALTVYRLGEGMFNQKKWEWLVCATALSEFSERDRKNANFIKKIYPDFSAAKKEKSAPFAIAQKLSLANIFYNEQLEKIYSLIKNKKLKILNKVASRVGKELRVEKKKFWQKAEFFKEKKIYFYYFNPKFKITSLLSTELSLEKSKSTVLLFSDTKSRPGFMRVSARNQSGLVDMNQLMRGGIVGLKKATAGGHVPASAASFMKKDLEKFKNNILKAIEL